MTAFNRPYLVGQEIDNILAAHESAHLSGNGNFTKSCEKLLCKITGASHALLTHSCTGALEIATLLAGIGPGDEVIMPSYTFVSTANAVVLRGATPVFVDIRPDTLNIDVAEVAKAISTRTRAIMPVDYAGVPCDFDQVNTIALENELLVIEDAAQALLSTYKGKAVGACNELTAISFHETKNVISGEGGALLLKSDLYHERAEIIREKGTNRQQFLEGLTNKYTWVDIGSSYLPNEITAAFLFAQLQAAEDITEKRLDIWSRYHAAFEPFEEINRLRRPVVPDDCRHNAHMYYLLLKDRADRDTFINDMKMLNINCVFHYVPLHSSPYGLKNTCAVGDLPVTDDISQRIVRLPLWIGLEKDLSKIISTMIRWFKEN